MSHNIILIKKKIYNYYGWIKFLKMNLSMTAFKYEMNKCRVDKGFKFVYEKS